jgi:hypothetical protein
MTEATGFEAKTIHRLLEVDPRAMRPTLKRSPNLERQSRLPLVAAYRQRELITRKPLSYIRQPRCEGIMARRHHNQQWHVRHRRLFMGLACLQTACAGLQSNSVTLSPGDAARWTCFGFYEPLDTSVLDDLADRRRRPAKPWDWPLQTRSPTLRAL